MLTETETLENHIRMLCEQNKMIEMEIGNFIREDDEIAEKLERRSQSPTNRHLHRAGDSCIKTYKKTMTDEAEESFR